MYSREAHSIRQFLILLRSILARLNFLLVIKTKSYSCCKRNGVYKMCIDRSCYCNRSRFSFELEKSQWCFKRNGVYKMCKYRSCYCSRCRVSFELEKSQWCCKRNGVCKMCIDRSCYCSICRFSFELEKVSGVLRGTVYTKCV